MTSNKGAAMIEFALVLPLLAMLAFGIIEFGFIIYNKAMITNASREGARVGILFNVNGNGDWEAISDTTISTTVNNYLSTNLITFGTPPSSITPTITRTANPSTGTLSPGGKLTVDVTYPYTFLVIPGFIRSIGPSISLSGVSAMRFE